MSLRPSGGTRPERELGRLEGDLALLAARLGALVDDPAFGGVAAMGIDQASQAVHLALLRVRHCVQGATHAAPTPR